MKKEGARYEWIAISCVMYGALEEVRKTVDFASEIFIEILFMIIASYTYYWVNRRLKKESTVKNILIALVIAITFSFISGLTISLIDSWQ